MERLFRTKRFLGRVDGNRVRSPQNQHSPRLLPLPPPPFPFPPIRRPVLDDGDDDEDGGDDDGDDEDKSTSSTSQSSASTSTASTSSQAAQPVSSTQQSSTRPTAQAISSSIAPSSTQLSTTTIATFSTPSSFTTSTIAVAVTTPPLAPSSSSTAFLTSATQSTPRNQETIISISASTISSNPQSSTQYSATAAATATSGISSSSPSSTSIAVGTVSAIGGIAIILTIIFFCYARYRARKKQVPTFDVYRRFSQYYHKRSRNISSQEALVETPPVPAMPANVQSQNGAQRGLELGRIAAVQELEEMEARMREEERAKAVADQEKAGWGGVGKWVKNQSRRHTETGGLEKDGGKEGGDVKEKSGRGTWHL